MMCKFPTRCRVQICCIVAAVFAALAGALTDQHAAYAQGGDNDYVDVGLILEVPLDVSAISDRDLNIIVVNNGSKNAYDVVVDVDVLYPKGSSYFLSPGDYEIVAGTLEVPVGSVSQGDDIYSLQWSIPALGGLQRETLTVKVIHKALPRDTVKFDKSLYPHYHYGEVTTSSFEE